MGRLKENVAHQLKMIDRGQAMVSRGQSMIKKAKERLAEAVNEVATIEAGIPRQPPPPDTPEVERARELARREVRSAGYVPKHR